ncbi:hypothetical protein BaRGS_00003638 [Batillaria attramentaria]|uniref:G-protein coupled receptors family 1 profile domain-containing protein n=1 Tax=Batillaria attramentaria TaxID=370345 RepID=A0ABD0M195_9CAEN
METNNGIQTSPSRLGIYGLELSVSQPEATAMENEAEEVTFTFETFVTMFTTLMCVVGNALILLVASLTPAFDNFNKCYLFSLTTADLFLGLFVTPFCIFNTMFDKFIFNSDMFCCVEAYLMALFIMVSMISIGCIIVDHYVAVRKPDRYSVMMSVNRSLCWVVLTWVIATSFCCPPLFSLQRAFYYYESFICIIDSKHQRAYFMTVMLLVSLPTMMAVLVTSRYLFTRAFKEQKKFFQRVYDYFSERSWNYYISFVITAMFYITWLPFTCIRLAEHVAGWRRDDIPPEIHFYCMWFGLSNCWTKFLVYLFMSPQFRQGLKEICETNEQHEGYALCGQLCSSIDSMESLDPNIIRIPPPRK